MWAGGRGQGAGVAGFVFSTDEASLFGVNHQKSQQQAAGSRSNVAILIWNFLSWPVWLRLLKCNPAAVEEETEAPQTPSPLLWFYFEEPP